MIWVIAWYVTWNKIKHLAASEENFFDMIKWEELLGRKRILSIHIVCHFRRLRVSDPLMLHTHTMISLFLVHIFHFVTIHHCHSSDDSSRKFFLLLLARFAEIERTINYNIKHENFFWNFFSFSLIIFLRRDDKKRRLTGDYESRAHAHRCIFCVYF